MHIVTNHDFICDLEHEVIKARNKFPNNRHLLAALMEEVGELAQALIQQDCEPEKGVEHFHVYKEAVQVAAMAMRIATEGDNTLPKYHPESGYRGPNWPGYKARE